MKKVASFICKINFGVGLVLSLALVLMLLYVIVNSVLGAFDSEFPLKINETSMLAIFDLGVIFTFVGNMGKTAFNGDYSNSESTSSATKINGFLFVVFCFIVFGLVRYALGADSVTGEANNLINLFGEIR